MKIKNSLIIALIAIAFYAGWSFDQSPAVSEEIPALQVKADRAGYVVAEQIRNQDPHYSPVANQPLQKQVFWGDTHLHSNFSMDAFIFGNTLGPDDAYRFAKGEKVMATKGQPAQLREPLDFLVLADHTDGVGAMIALKAGNEKLLANPHYRLGRRFYLPGRKMMPASWIPLRPDQTLLESWKIKIFAAMPGII